MPVKFCHVPRYAELKGQILIYLFILIANCTPLNGLSKNVNLFLILKNSFHIILILLYNVNSVHNITFFHNSKF